MKNLLLFCAICLGIGGMLLLCNSAQDEELPVIDTPVIVAPVVPNQEGSQPPADMQGKQAANTCTSGVCGQDQKQSVQKYQTYRRIRRSR